MTSFTRAPLCADRIHFFLDFLSAHWFAGLRAKLPHHLKESSGVGLGTQFARYKSCNTAGIEQTGDARLFSYIFRQVQLDSDAHNV